MTMMTKAKTIARYMLDIAWPDPVADDFRVHPDAAENAPDVEFVKRPFGKRKPVPNQEISTGLLLNP